MRQVSMPPTQHARHVRRLHLATLPTVSAAAVPLCADRRPGTLLSVRLLLLLLLLRLYEVAFIVERVVRRRGYSVVSKL